MTEEDELRAIEIFRDLGAAEIAWLAAHTEIVEADDGEAFLLEGDPAAYLFGVLDGEVRGRKEKGLPDGLVYVVRKGQVSGMLPHSRMTHYPITARAVGRSRVAMVPARIFPEIIAAIPVLETRLASVMADRVKDTTEQIQLRERLIGLGKLSAGLAHELNNPAAAIRRSVEELQGRVAGLSEMCASLLAELADPAYVERIGALRDRRDLHASSDVLERSDAEDDLATWLQAQGVEEPWVAAETFVASGIRRADLEVDAGTHAPARTRTLRWLEAHLAARQLVAEIADAAERISGIVGSVKSYSHMDRAPAEGTVDLIEGLESTLAVLAHKWRVKGLRIVRSYAEERPRVMGNAGELNQVWTNLLDNAIDASPPEGRITVGAQRSGGEFVVSIGDEGAGIEDAVRERMFEPFFSTKGVGHGSGLGLDIAKRIVGAHRGWIRVESAPGRTRFEVGLPEDRTGPATDRTAS